MNEQKPLLEETYRCLAELWCSPQDVEREKVGKDAGAILEKWRGVDGESAFLLENFIKKNSISEEEYVDLFELDPKCPLYLGSHVYEEPKTCAGAGVSDRNEYMIELQGIYKHFGLTPDGKELPDYLPAMMEFLSLTIQSRNDPVRKKLIREYILPFLPPLRSKLEELKSPYSYLLSA